MKTILVLLLGLASTNVVAECLVRSGGQLVKAKCHVVIDNLVNYGASSSKSRQNNAALMRVCGIPVTHAMEKVPAALYYETKKDAKELDQPDKIVECTNRKTGRPAFVEVFSDGKASAWLFN